VFIYDQTTLAFNAKAENILKEILISCGFEVYRTRFLYNHRFYPINVVTFEGSELGHFSVPYLQIGLNKKLIYLAKDSVLRDILKHELAHYLTYVFYGEVKFPHGEEFKKICRQFHFPDDVERATIDLDLANEKKEGDLESEKIIEKVKKLLSLAQSSNVNEAELATLKANELLLRHNLNSLPDKKMSLYLERLMIQSRRDAKMEAIVEIIRHFIVRPVISYGQNTCCIEVSGTLTNVKLASYVIHFLIHELDRLWLETKSTNGLQGVRSKNSFFRGVARGFNLKMKDAKSSYSPEDQSSLVLVEKNLIEETNIIYKRLSSSSSHGQHDAKASALGIEKGKKLHIHQGVEAKNTGLAIARGVL